VNAPYLLTGALLVVVALVISWKSWDGRTQPELSDHAWAS
jgi:hypothetical protein